MSDQDPRYTDTSTEPGPHPPNAERHGVWKILARSSGLTVVGLAVAAVIAFAVLS
ncbi:MAG: hypothetical protein AAF415_15105 [Pseudomonadota bacterium]